MMANKTGRQFTRFSSFLFWRWNQFEVCWPLRLNQAFVAAFRSDKPAGSTMLSFLENED